MYKLEFTSSAFDDLGYFKKAKQNFILDNIGRKYILSEVDGLSQEIEQIRNNPELMEFLAHRSQEKERFSLEQVKQKLGL
ncbi:MAG: hypothetical protein ACREYE_07405 [Gammaproteobacteria bacterium]